ncbi:MAG: hypothetical protein ACR2NV_06315 [Thermoleophilaceae bacterium]
MVGIALFAWLERRGSAEAARWDSAGASEGPLVQSLAPAGQGIEGLGLDPGTAVEIAYTADVLVSVLLAYGLRGRDGILTNWGSGR